MKTKELISQVQEVIALLNSEDLSLRQYEQVSKRAEKLSEAVQKSIEQGGADKETLVSLQQRLDGVLTGVESSSDNASNPYGLFGSLHTREDVHVDEFDIELEDDSDFPDLSR